MKKDDLKYKTYHSYHIPGCSNLHTLKINAIFISTANSIKHEMKKLQVCYNLNKMGYDFLTEAVDNKTGLRRDVVCLDTGEVYEIETTKQRAKRFEGTNVNVILVE